MKNKMTRNQALDLQEDWGKELDPRDFNETLYLSVNKVGVQVIKQCCCHEHDGYIFIWTLEKSFLISRELFDDFILVKCPVDTITSVKKQKKVS